MRLLRRLAYWLRAREHDDALREEMEYHRARIQADLEAGGMSPRDATAASRRAMGNVAALRDDARDVWLLRWLDRIVRDARYGLRGLRREPTFALAAILTLTIGVAATTTVFSVVDAELWRPMPYPEPDRLVVAYVRGPGRGAVEPVSERDIDAWRNGAPAFQTLAITGTTRRATLMLDHAESVIVEAVTSDLSETLTRPVLAGRSFRATDRGGAPVAVLTDRTWTRLFERDPSVVGRTVTIDGASVAVVGVVAADDALGPDADLFVNLDAAGHDEAERLAPRYWRAVGRLAPGVEIDVAQEQVRAATVSLARADPERWDGRTVHLEGLREYHTGFNTRPLFFFLGAALVVLVLTMVNVASLLVARALRRTREFALRGALGGGRGVLSGQLVVEGVLLALPAGALALLATYWAVGIVGTLLPADALARGGDIPVDYRAAMFALGLTGVTAIAFGLMPLAVVRRLDPGRLLGGGTRTGATAVEGRVRMTLLAVQLGLTVILLAGAGLFLKSFSALTDVDPGFDPAGAAAVRIPLPADRYADAERWRAYADELLAAASAAPGVTRAAIGSSSPLGSGPVANYVNPDLPRPGEGEEPRAILRFVTPGFFDTLAIPVLRGRAFAATDVAGAPRVAIVNEVVASQAFGDADPIGGVLDLIPWRGSGGLEPGPVTVVGVARDIKEIGINEVSFGGIYLPFAQQPVASFELVGRGTASAGDVAALLRAAALGVDPAVPITRTITFEQRVDDALRGDRFNAMLISVFAAVAVLLAGIGVFGAVAYAVQARTREFGVRMAFGARPVQLMGSSIRRVVRLTVIGGLAGLAATVMIARLSGDAFYLVPGSHNGLLYQVSMTDPTVLGAAFAGLIAVATLAAALPARRAARIDPVDALRAD